VVKNRRFQNMMPRLLCLSLLPSQTGRLHNRHNRNTVYRMSEKKKQAMMKENSLYHAVLATVRKINLKPVRASPIFHLYLCLSHHVYLFSPSITSAVIQRSSHEPFYNSFIFYTHCLPFVSTDEYTNM